MRKLLIAANWKMYKTPDQAREFFRDFLPLVQGHDRDQIVVCPTYLALDAAINAAKGSNVAIGAQDLHWEKDGAFTGEVNAAMLLAPVLGEPMRDFRRAWASACKAACQSSIAGWAAMRSRICAISSARSGW